MHGYKTCWSISDHLNKTTIRTKKYGRFSIMPSGMFARNSVQNILRNWSFRNLTPNRMKYFVAKYFAENY